MSLERRSVAGRLVRYGARLALAVVLAPFAYVLLFALGALFVRYPPLAPRPSESAPAAVGEIRGAFHIHSTLSDGRGTPSEIAAAAKAAGLQFIVLTDHNLRTLSEPAFEHGVLVISGVELSTGKGHLVVVGAPRGLEQPGRDLDPIRHSQELGGLTIIAHPVQRKQPWIDAKSAGRAEGMELYSADSLFRDALHSPFELLLPAAGAYLINPMHALMILNREQPQATSKLLEMSAREPKLALCAHDAHGWPAYELVFRSFSLHVPRTATLESGLPADPSDAARAVIEALARARFYCAFDALGAAHGFAVDGPPPGSRRSRVGDRLLVRLPASPPARTQVRIWGGGRLEADGRTVWLQRPGPMQIEVWIAAPGMLFGSVWKPWIVSSPIHVSAQPESSEAATGQSASSSDPPHGAGLPGSR
jgi:hypothetical protein